MGWDYHYKSCKTVRELLQEDIGANGEIIAFSQRGSIAYMAVRSAQTGEVVAAVAQIRRAEGMVGFKLMAETEEPRYYDCPKKILDLLSPTDSAGARAWRQGCAQKSANPKVPIGSTVELLPGTWLRQAWQGHVNEEVLSIRIERCKPPGRRARTLYVGTLESGREVNLGGISAAKLAEIIAEGKAVLRQ